MWSYSEFLGSRDSIQRLGGKKFSSNIHSWVGLLMTFGAKIVTILLVIRGEDSWDIHCETEKNILTYIMKREAHSKFL